MKRVAWGIVVGGAVAAAFAGSAANATGDTWTPDYDVGGAQLFAQLPTLTQEGWSPVWELPASFTTSTGATLTGTDYLTTSSGGFNDEFITKEGAVYDQNQLGGGFTNLYYDPSSIGTAVDMMKTPFGTVDLSSMASLFAPADVTGLSTAAEVGNNIVFADFGGIRIQGALDLDNGQSGHGWAGGPADGATVTTMQAPDSSLVWSVPTTFTQTIGAHTTTLTGTEYLTSPTDVEFVDKAGDVFDQHLLAASGLLFADNHYYDPVDGPAQDVLETTFGNWDISPIASWFAPAEVADLVTPSLLTDLADAGLYSVLDLGLPS